MIFIVAAPFIVGLIFVVIAQVMAFFTMAKRGENARLREHEILAGVSAVYTDRIGGPARTANRSAAQRHFSEANQRLDASNRFRKAGLIRYGLSVLAFIVGCALGAIVVTLSKSA